MNHQASGLIGVDLGGTKIAVGLVENGTVKVKRRIETDAERGPEAIVADIAGLAKDLAAEYGTEVRALGIGVPGQVEAGTGLVKFAPNLRWSNVPVGEMLRHALGCAVSVTNDVRSIAYGEWTHGAAQGSQSVACVFVGTGIGGGLIIDGKLQTGAGGSSGEVGHMTIVTGGRKCTCPGKGCWEAYAGGWGIGERVRDAVAADPTLGKTLQELAEKEGEPLSAKHLDAAYHLGDPLAKRLVAETADYLAAGMVTLLNILNPEVLVLGGGVLEGIPELADLAIRQVQVQALQSAVSSVKIVRSSLGSDAGIIGSATLAFHEAGS